MLYVYVYAKFDIQYFFFLWINTDKLDDFVKKQSLESQISKVLKDYRVLLVEELYHLFKMTNNTHHIAGFHNYLAKDIGVTPYNDVYITTPYSSKCQNWEKWLSERYFTNHYTKIKIIKHIIDQVNETKIGYQKVA